MEPAGKRFRACLLSLFSSVFWGFLAARGSAARSKALQDCKIQRNPGLGPLPTAGAGQLKACPFPPPPPAQNSANTGQEGAFGSLGLVLTSVAAAMTVLSASRPHTGPLPLGTDWETLWSLCCGVFRGGYARVCVRV